MRNTDVRLVVEFSYPVYRHGQNSETRPKTLETLFVNPFSVQMTLAIRRQFCGGAPGVDVECHWQIRLRWHWRGWWYERCWYPFRARFSERELNQYKAEALYLLAVVPAAKTVEEIREAYSRCKFH